MAEEAKNFHKSIKTIILIANFLGLRPANGVTSDLVESLNFRWFCPKTVSTCTLILIAFSETLCSAVVLYQRGISSFTFCKLTG